MTEGIRKMGEYRRQFKAMNKTGGPLCLEVNFLVDGEVLWRTCIPATMLPQDGSKCTVQIPCPDGAQQTRTRILYYDGEHDLPRGTAWTLAHLPSDRETGGFLECEVSMHMFQPPHAETQ